MTNLDQCFASLSPVEKVGELYLKREDLFKPFADSPVNGSKLRQLIYLLLKAKSEGYTRVIAGAVANSPQHIMVATVCKNLELGCSLVVGVKNIEGHKILEMADKLGAEFRYCNIGYAKNLEADAFKLQKDLIPYEKCFVVETNITLSEKLHTPEELRDFHGIGAFQVHNIPKEVDTLILPCGSCNSAVSVLFGIHSYSKLSTASNIKKLILCGIGNIGSKDINYIFKRLDYMGVDMFGRFEVEYHNINGSGYCSYEDLMPFKLGDIEMHPRYEGKIFNYFKDKNIKLSNNSLFWLVGSEPK